MERIKNTKELDQQYADRINRELYKRNIELAIKNKILSLLRKLYDITISSVVGLEDLAFRLAIEIRQDLNFEMVGIYLLKEDNKELKSLAIIKSERFSGALKKEKITSVLNTIKLKKDKENICDLVIKEQKEEWNKSFTEIWSDKKFFQAFFDIQKKLPIKAIAIYPLLIEEKILGILIIALNQEYKLLSIFEKETIENFISVIAIALNKTITYEQLKKTNKQLENLMLKLSKAYEELKILDKAKSEFISMASHQLRTPLTILKGYVSMVLEGDFGEISEKVKEKLFDVFQSNERLIKLVNELLDISRIELGKMELNKEPVQIEDLIQSCYDEIKIQAEKKKLKLIWQKPKNFLPKIEVDPFKIRQVILNLIDNALKYTKNGEIKIKAEKINSFLRISIKDTGEGLTEEEQENIFKGFVRGKAGTACWTEGVGLGLYVAKKYLELYQGKIWAESEGIGKGSTFYIEIPENT